MLMPAAVLVLLILGAITVDYAHLYLQKQELQTAAEAAVNDALTWGLDQAALRRGDGVALDGRRVRDAVTASLAAHGTGLTLTAPPVIDQLGPTRLRVTLVARVDYVFVPAIAGMSRSALVRASATADLD